jgi:hypothetical protein
MPWQLRTAALCWAVLGVVLLGVGLERRPGVGVPREIGMLGDDVVAATAQPGGSVLWVLLGASVLLVAGLLALGQGWARMMLVVLGAASVLVLAFAGRWEALPAMVLVTVGAFLPLAPRAHRYLVA